MSASAEAMSATGSSGAGQGAMSANWGASLGLANIWVAMIAFAAAAILGLYQVAERAGFALNSAELYFGSV